MKTIQKHIRSEELHTLDQSWRRLHWWQKKHITLIVHMRRLLTAITESLPRLIEHIQRRQNAIIVRLLFPAHWLRR